MSEPPEHIMKAALSTLHAAMVFCRNYTAGKYPENPDPQLVYELMQAIHAIPQILDQWGVHNDIDTLRIHLRCFDHRKWRNDDLKIYPPDLLCHFETVLEQFGPKETLPWFKDAKPVSALQAEICFLIQDDLEGTPLAAPDIPRKVAQLVRSSEAIGHAQELAEYYKQIVRIARKRKLPFNEYRQKFWMRLFLWNTEANVSLSFPWYDQFDEMKKILDEISRIEEGWVYDDVDQGWELIIHAHNGKLYIREGDPDNEDVEDTVMISVPRSKTLELIPPLKDRVTKIIAYLSRELGCDVWTEHSYDEPLFQFPEPTPTKPWWKLW